MVAVTADKVLLELNAKVNDHIANVNKASANFDRRIQQMEKTATRSVGRMSSIFAGLVTLATLKKAQDFLDSNTRIQNALKLTGLQGEALADTYGRLGDIAQRNGASFESLAVLYGRAAQSAKELGASESELIRFTEGVAASIKVAGTSTEAARGALLQLSQAIGSARVQAEEFNSINEGAKPILQTVADNIKEAGGSVSRLKSLVNDGKISNEIFFKAFLQGSADIINKAQDAELTIGGAFENLQTAAITVAGQLDEKFQITDKVIAGIEGIGDAIRDLPAAIDEVMPWLNKFAEWAQFIADIPNLSAKIGTSVGDTLGTRWIGPAIGEALAPSGRAFKEGIFGGVPQTTGDLMAQLGMTPDWKAPYAGNGPGRSPTGPGKKTPLSVNDFAVAGSGTGAGKESPFVRESRQIREATDALIAQQGALASINPLVNDYGFQLEFAQKKAELLAAAQREGIAITPEVEAGINRLAEGYANASVQVAQLTEQQDRLRDQAEEIRGAFQDAASTFIQGLREGKSAADSFKDALGQILEKLADMALNNAFNALFGAPGSMNAAGGNIFGTIASALFGGFFADGGQLGSGKWGIAGENGPEIIRGPASITPAGTGGTSVAITNNNDFSGVDPTSVARILANQDRLKRETVAASVQAVQAENRRRPQYLRGGK